MGLSQQFQVLEVLEVLEVLPLFLGAKVTEGWCAYNIWFIGFNRLLSEHFIAHRDISFYADQLCITGDYLSRIVKRVSGRTVGDMINQMLMMEACYLLRTSSLSIAQISQRLHFSEPASFTRFFIRVKGMTPKEFRNKAVHA
jgi:AraC-like DNA-binding protein